MRSVRRLAVCPAALLCQIQGHCSELEAKYPGNFILALSDLLRYQLSDSSWQLFASRDRAHTPNPASKAMEDR
jgi:hypothetical protein